MNGKSREFIYKDNKEMLKNYCDVGCGYNFDETKKREIQKDYNRVYRFVNREFIRNNKIR